MVTLADTLRAEPKRLSHFGDLAHSALLRRAPGLISFFGPNPHTELTTAVLFILTHSTPGPQDSGTQTPLSSRIDAAGAGALRALATEHVAYMPPDPALYLAAADALCEALRDSCADQPFQQVLAAEKALREACSLMATHAKSLEPTTTTATVVDVEQRNADIVVVRMVAQRPITYLAGQQVQACPDITPGQWRRLAPALPSNDQGHVEWHLPKPSPGPRAGDPGTRGLARGNTAVTGDQELLLIAEETGLASARAIILDLLQRGVTTRTHLFFGGTSPGRLYDLLGLWQLAGTSPWLSITPVYQEERDPWWLSPSEHCSCPRGLHLPQVGSLADVVPRFGSWEDRDVLIFAPDHTINDVASAMRAAGTPGSHIRSLRTASG